MKLLPITFHVRCYHLVQIDHDQYKQKYQKKQLTPPPTNFKTMSTIPLYVGKPHLPGLHHINCRNVHLA